jgi:polyhydroxyalkanoate synthesis regulator phasin
MKRSRIINIKNQKGNDMAALDVTSTTDLQGTQQTQGHHHHMSMSQRVDKMESLIDQAVKDGKLTDDQATQMKKQLDDIKTTLANAKTSGTPLTDDQRKQIRQDMQSIGKQLFSAINPPQNAPAAASTASANLFSKIDANGDGNIDQNEFSAFMDQLKNNPQSLVDAFSPTAYNQQGSITISTMQQSTISISA